MSNLNNRNELTKIDKSGALLSNEQLAFQITQAWKDIAAIDVPSSYKDVENVVVCGMGASWLGAHIIQGLFADQLKVPVLIVHDYQLPHFVDEKTLVIASSYSGTTEETISGLDEAFKRKAKIFTITKGGYLDSFSSKNNLAHYTFDPIHNPAKAPRLGVGYSLTAQIALLSKLEVIHVSDKEILDTTEHLMKRNEELKPESNNNQAMQIAVKLKSFIPIVISGTFLLGVAHTISNQFNETSKTFATYMNIPELNHHNLEGLSQPKEVENLKYLFLESSFYDTRVTKRIEVTKDVVKQNKVGSLSYRVNGSTKIIQAFDALQFGGFVSFYLAMLYGFDPSPNPWVDYFKAQLAKQ